MLLLLVEGPGWSRNAGRREPGKRCAIGPEVERRERSLLVGVRAGTQETRRRAQAQRAATSIGARLPPPAELAPGQLTVRCPHNNY